jgi:hypothetical protein
MIPSDKGLLSAYNLSRRTWAQVVCKRLSASIRCTELPEVLLFKLFEKRFSPNFPPLEQVFVTVPYDVTRRCGALTLSL